ncbi:MAG: flippase-like domain-containing protein [Candidatus Omnitrophota bacterium]
MKILKKAILALAAALFVWIVFKSGPDLIIAQIVSLNWKIAVVVIAYMITYYFDTTGWRWAFRREVKLPSFWRFFLARQAGEAINYTTPTAYIGGEPVKALVLRKRDGVDMVDGLASVVIAKTSLFLSKVVFLLAGIIVALRIFKFSGMVATGILWTFAGVFVLLVLFLFLQKKGLFMLGLKMARKFKLSDPLEGKRTSLEEIDRVISDFYANERPRFFLSFIFHLLGWFAGLIEVYIIMYFLGVQVDWAKALVIEVFFKAANSAFFFVPAALGVQEGAGYAVLAALGIGGEIGVALSIVKRIREIAWAGFGLIIYWKTPK